MLNKLDTPATPRKKSAAKSFTYKEQHGIIVMCKGERDQRRVYNRLTRIGYSCKVVVT